MTDIVVTLTCEDASHLGGPMGSEYTTLIFSRPFGSIESAKKYAEKYQEGFPKWATWRQQRKYISCDSGPYIWRITSQEIEK